MPGVPRVGACILCASLVTGCSTVPPLSHATNNFPFTSSIPVQEIVQRVKCELSNSFDEKMQQPDFKWIRSWTVKADLTLEVDETGGVSPSLTYIQPLKNAFYPGAGPSSISTSGVPGTTIPAVAQNFTFGFGANLSGSVTRTELISFALSLRELQAWRKAQRRFEREHGIPEDHACHPAGINDLQGSLDLKAWVDAALKPVDYGLLESGLHPDPGSGRGGASASSSTPKQKGPAEVAHPWPNCAEELKLEFEMNLYQSQADAFAMQAATSAQQAMALKLTALASDTLEDRFKRAVTERASKIIWFAKQAHMADIDAHQKAYTTELSALTMCLKESGDCPDYETFKQDLPKVESQFKTAKSNAVAAAQELAQAQRLANPDPPINSISHSLNFVVTAGAGFSPSWTLLHWKGPSTNGNLASVSSIRTHTLNIVLGPPGIAGSSEEARVLDNQAIRQAIQSLAQ